jgi:transcriptional regulator with XRE-family HTH domain
MLLSIQIKIGRILLKMDQKEFSKLIGISLQSFKRLETNDEALANASHKTIQKIIKILEEKGIEFLYLKNDQERIVGVSHREILKQSEIKLL